MLKTKTKRNVFHIFFMQIRKKNRITQHKIKQFIKCGRILRMVFVANFEMRDKISLHYQERLIR